MSDVETEELDAMPIGISIRIDTAKLWVGLFIFHIVGFCPLFMLWDSVLWDFVLWDFVRRDYVLWDFVLWDSVPDSIQIGQIA